MSMIPGGTGTAASFPDGIIGSQRANVQTIVATLVLTSASNRLQLITPSGATRTVQLPVTGVLQGEEWIVMNAAGSGQSLIVAASNGSTIITLAPGESGRVVASVAAPVASTDWQIQVQGITLADGSVSVPSLRFSGASADTGIYSPGTDQIAFSQNGVQTLLATAAGAFTLGASTGLTVGHILQGAGQTGGAGTFTDAGNQGGIVSLLDTVSGSGQGGGIKFGSIQSGTPKYIYAIRSNLTNGANNGGGTLDVFGRLVSTDTAMTLVAQAIGGSWTFGNVSAIGGTGYGGNNLIGRTNGTTVAAGYVGQVVEVTRTTNLTLSSVAGTYSDVLTGLSLTPGEWEVEANMNFYIQGAAGTGGNGRNAVVYITDNANTQIRGIVGPFVNSQNTNGAGSMSMKIRLTVSATTTYKLRAATEENSAATTNPTLVQTICATNAPAVLRAVRVA